MFEKCFRGVAENYRTEKLEAFRGILVNSAIGFNASQEEREYFVNLVKPTLCRIYTSNHR